jgi:hypothetical protein
LRRASSEARRGIALSGGCDRLARRERVGDVHYVVRVQKETCGFERTPGGHVVRGDVPSHDAVDLRMRHLVLVASPQPITNDAKL